MAGVHKDTLLRWLRDGRIDEPNRNRNGWRVFSNEEAEKVLEYANGSDDMPTQIMEPVTVYSEVDEKIAKLKKVDWDFTNANSSYLTHSVHPYPAKFIPQIPKTLIRELASTGETVLDPFCGSGTTLVEALRLECNAIGIDANPLACLISRAKSHIIKPEEGEILLDLANEIEKYSHRSDQGTLPLFDNYSILPSVAKRPKVNGINDWFDAVVIDELAFIKSKCLELETQKLRDIALVAFSSIIVTVSRQDSDTRYVRRDKNIQSGHTLGLFCRALRHATKRAFELSEEVNERCQASIIEANILQPPEIGTVDMVVCSPPYPNAYSYHLYHRTRMMWLDMNQPRFKQEEIGSHRKYSSKSKNAATVDTFRGELYTILSWLKRTLRYNGYACFVIGDSTLKGQRIENDKLLIDVAESLGYYIDANINRTLQSTRKSFNPALGKIKEEHIVVLKNKCKR